MKTHKDNEKKRMSAEELLKNLDVQNKALKKILKKLARNNRNH
jgi:hypothetical protein